MSADSRPNQHAERPNIVLIIADDMGFGDIGCYNPDSRIPTPNIDALAERGTRWTDMHTPSAVCTPSRYGMLTGRYCWRGDLSYGVLYGYEPPLIESGRPTLASRLSAAGYHTACIGKWHLGLEFRAKRGEDVDFGAPLPWRGVDLDLEQRIDLTAAMGGGPLERGFDSFFGTAGCSTAQPPFAFIEGDRFVEEPTEFRPQIHFTGRPGMTAPGWDHAAADPVFCDQAVDKIAELSAKPDPFFLYLAASAPHEPCLQATVPEFARGMSQAGHRGDLVWLYDWMVGRITDALKRAGVAENTLLIVTSDNGALPGDRVNEQKTISGYELYGHRSCGRLRGYKAHIWEGGHRVPFVAGPAESTSAGGPGAVDDTLACLTDLFATLPAIAGSPDEVEEDALDLSARPTFSQWAPPGNRAATRSRIAMVHHSGFGVFSVRSGPWKLISESAGSGGWPPPAGTFPVAGGDGQLYDLNEDPEESRNLFEERPETVSEMDALIRGFRNGNLSVR